MAAIDLRSVLLGAGIAILGMGATPLIAPLLAGVAASDLYQAWFIAPSETLRGFGLAGTGLLAAACIAVILKSRGDRGPGSVVDALSRTRADLLPSAVVAGCDWDDVDPALSAWDFGSRMADKDANWLTNENFLARTFGFNGLTSHGAPHLEALAIALLKCGMGPDEEGILRVPGVARSDAFLDALSREMALLLAGKPVPDGDGLEKLDLSRISSLVGAWSVREAWVAAALADFRTGEGRFSGHAYPVTRLLALLHAIRSVGHKVPSSEFTWLRAFDRPIWYALNNLGRQKGHVEGVGAIHHWRAERAAGTRITDPCIDAARDLIPATPRFGGR